MATFSTSVGLAMVEDMTPERIPQITLVSKVSSERKEWEGNCKLPIIESTLRETGENKLPSGRSTSNRLKLWYVPILMVP